MGAAATGSLHHAPPSGECVDVPDRHTPHRSLCSQPVGHLTLRWLSVGAVFPLPGRASSARPALCGVACCEKLTEGGEGALFCVLSALCSPDRLWSIPLSPTPQPSPVGTVRPVYISCFVSKSLGQKSRPLGTSLSQPPLNSFVMMAGTEPGRHSLQSVLSS